MVQIIRTCSLASVALIALAAPVVSARTPLMDYAAGRMADIDGASRDAAIAYASALAASPGDAGLAQRAYRQAMDAGDRELALAAARRLETQSSLPADGALLLFIERLSKRDWTGAQLRLAKLDPAVGLGFLVPILRAWTQYGADLGDPLATLNIADKDSLILTYAREHRILIQIARGELADGRTALEQLVKSGPQALSLRLAAASQFAASGDKVYAVSLLTGDDVALKTARARIMAGQPTGSEIDRASKGISALFSRVASDLMRDRATPAALMLARLASFAEPNDQTARLVLAQALLANGKVSDALNVITQAPQDSLFAPALRELRVEALQQSGRDVEGLAAAKAAAALPDASVNDMLLLGQSYSRLSRFADAATAFENVIKSLGGNAEKPAEGQGVSSWRLWLLYGGALDAAKDWKRAKPALQRAVELGPDQPSALNHLGYAMLERGDNLEEATRLIAKASSLRPQDPAITDSLGWAFFKRGQTSEAIAILEKAVETDPTIAETSEHLGDAYWTAGRKVDARYTWRASLVQAADDESRQRLNAKIADGLPSPRQ